ncbi:MAG: hypothetical protein ABI187_05105 [Ornithinibacter sp.]
MRVRAIDVHHPRVAPMDPDIVLSLTGKPALPDARTRLTDARHNLNQTSAGA